MNPHHWPINDFSAIRQMYEALLNNDGKARPIIPWLASSWKSTSPTTLLMHLRKGVTFHDGAEFNAEALKYQMDWTMDRNNGTWTRGWLKNIKSIQVLDPHTVEEARPGNYLKLKRNPYWWFGRSIGQSEMPWFDGRITTVIPDSSVQLANLRTRKLDRIDVSPVQYQMLKKDSKLDVQHFPPNDINFLIIKGTNGPCSDGRVRKAISHAIDRKAIVRGVLKGLATEASCLYPQNHWAHNPDLHPVAYDPEFSKKLLEEAGFGDGLTIKEVVPNAGNLNKTVATAIKNMLDQVGITWNYDLLDPVAANDRFKNAEYDLAWVRYTYITEPDMSASSLYTPTGQFNLGRNNNKAAVELIAAGCQEMDATKRRKLYHRLEEVIYNNYEDFWLYYPEALFAQQKKVKGWSTKLYLKGGRGFVRSHPLWFEDGRQ